MLRKLVSSSYLMPILLQRGLAGEIPKVMDHLQFLEDATAWQNVHLCACGLGWGTTKPTPAREGGGGGGGGEKKVTIPDAVTTIYMAIRTTLGRIDASSRTPPPPRYAFFFFSPRRPRPFNNSQAADDVPPTNTDHRRNTTTDRWRCPTPSNRALFTLFPAGQKSSGNTEHVELFFWYKNNFSFGGGGLGAHESWRISSMCALLPTRWASTAGLARANEGPFQVRG